MKNLLFLFCFFAWVFPLLAQSPEKTQNLSPEVISRLKEKGIVRYEDFGAVGDGIADDLEAIVAAHAFANPHGLRVKAEDNAVYFIGGKNLTAIIKTDTDFGTASFLIDDRNVENKNAPVFKIVSSHESYTLSEGILSLKKNQHKIDLQFPQTSLVTVTNSNVKHYIRFGLNQNNGAPQTDIFLVDKNGFVDRKAPIIWDFDQITEITVQPVDPTTLTIKGGIFTTIANAEKSEYQYYSRNLSIQRSNVILDGLEHRIVGEGDQGAPYGGFVHISGCTNVTVQNTILTGHKTYQTIGNAGKPVSMGSYDILVVRALNVSFVNCSQKNDIDDSLYWGIMGSNYCKNLIFDACKLSRFDAHMGVANATIRNSTLGHMGINAIGSGILLVENSEIRGRNLVNLRSDYGSTWEGELIISNCKFIPAAGKAISATLINGSNSGQHDFGYTCFMPEQIKIENLWIDDSNSPENDLGPAIFGNFNSEFTDGSYQEKFPYVKTKKVWLKNVTTVRGRPLRISDNEFMFNQIEVVVD